MKKQINKTMFLMLLKHNSRYQNLKKIFHKIKSKQRTSRSLLHKKVKKLASSNRSLSRNTSISKVVILTLLDKLPPR